MGKVDTSFWRIGTPRSYDFTTWMNAVQGGYKDAWGFVVYSIHAFNWCCGSGLYHYAAPGTDLVLKALGFESLKKNSFHFLTLFNFSPRSCIKKKICATESSCFLFIYFYVLLPVIGISWDSLIRF
jgi:hypothetical protein